MAEDAFFAQKNGVISNFFDDTVKNHWVTLLFAMNKMAQTKCIFENNQYTQGQRQLQNIVCEAYFNKLVLFQTFKAFEALCDKSRGNDIVRITA